MAESAVLIKLFPDGLEDRGVGVSCDNVESRSGCQGRGQCPIFESEDEEVAVLIRSSFQSGSDERLGVF